MALCTTYKEEELVALLQQGREQAFNEIYYRYWRLLFSLAAHKLQDQQVANELVQDVFVQLWKRREKLQITYGLKAYLAAAIKYRVYSYLASRQQSRRRSLDPDSIHKAYTPEIEEQMDLQDLLVTIDQVVARLPERCRLVYQLSREAGLSHAEIADRLHISPKTVENQLTKALKSFRTALRLGLFSFLAFFF